MFKRIISNLLPLMPEKLVWHFSKQYIAGETIDDAIEAARKLKQQGIMTTIDLLGEFITSMDEAKANKDRYLEIIEAVRKTEIDGNYSLKPTFFGLLIDKEKAFSHIREIVDKAASYNHFVCIDMEDSPCTDMEIELFKSLVKDYPNTVGLVIQAYLKRSFKDIDDLSRLNSEVSPVNLRLCKGIYVEPPDIAYQDYETINQHFIEDIDLMFSKKMYPAIATHDTPVVDAAIQLIEKYQIPREKYEFQMLYGVTPKLRQSILDKGHRMRVYIPFGKQWFGYSVRRIKENPKLGEVFLKALFFKG